MRASAARLTCLARLPRRARAGAAAMAALEPPAALRVHAATPAELAAARAHLDAAGAVLARAGAGAPPPLLCALEYADGGAAAATFRPAPYFAALGAAALGRVVLAAGALPSTQAVVQGNPGKLPDGALVLADRQLGGRGRGGNAWVSPPGCLAFSLGARLRLPGERVPFVQYLASLAVVGAVQAAAAAALGAGAGAAPLDVRIKWPNDVYAGGLKLAGVLCHSACRAGEFAVTVGIGINVANRAPTTCVDALVAAAAAARGAPAPPPTTREALLGDVCARLATMLERLAVDGFAPFEADYCAAWLHSGQRVELEEGGSGVGDDAPTRVALTVTGLTPHGFLRAEDADGAVYELHPDGNSLDFFRGLVRRKL
jgi:biotin--protein ligase